ncbi:unnamed protein product [Amoebophrya sp. A25]|nr:unnamed protein product [Amoebophrya sp. A25]|eukprot:GSA25T00003887001.1
MSLVTVQLGQCGNQVGSTFFDELAAKIPLREDDAVARMFFRWPTTTICSATEQLKNLQSGCSSSSSSSFNTASRPLPFARSVLVDLEPRVVGKLISPSRSQGYRFDARGAKWRASGAGNNWTHGYRQGRDSLSEELELLVQAEVDRCHDQLAGFLVFFSLAGGTGSGLGSFAITVLRELYPKTPILACCVLPFRSGEVAVQSFNACLALHAVYEHADLVFPFENRRRDGKRLGAAEEARSEEFSVMNTSIVNTLLHAAMLPVLAVRRLETTSDPKTAMFRELEPRLSSVFELSVARSRIPDMLCSLGAHPSYKLVTLRHLPVLDDHSKRRLFGRGSFSDLGGNDSWAALSKRLSHICTTKTVEDFYAPLAGERNRVLAAAVTCYGPGPRQRPTPASQAAAEDHTPPLDEVAGIFASGLTFSPKSRILAASGAPSLSVVQDYYNTSTPGSTSSQPSLSANRVSLATNCQTPLAAFESAVHKAAGLSRARCYVHFFDEAPLAEAILGVTQICEDYRQL